MAVYTDVGAEELEAFLSGYDIGELLSYKGIAEGVENSNFLVHTSRGSFILTLYEKRVAAADLPFFLALMQHLASRGITCPQPVKNRAGAVLGEVAGRPAAIITFLEGMWIRRPSAGHCGPLGDTIQPNLSAALAAQLEEVEKAWPGNLPQGVIHADLFPDNVFFLGDK